MPRVSVSIWQLLAHLETKAHQYCVQTGYTSSKKQQPLITSPTTYTMASVASCKQMFSLSKRSYNIGTTCISSAKRSMSLVAMSRTQHANSGKLSGDITTCTFANKHHTSSPLHSQPRRHFSKYVVVDHSLAYQNSMASNHGLQLQLALEEGRGKDDAPFDPFSQFLDQMGSTKESEEELDGETVDEGMNGIDEAEFKEMDQYDDDDDDDEEDEEAYFASSPLYTTSGAVHRPLSERLALRAGYPAGGKFAVIHLAGFQHKVTTDDLLIVNKLKPVSEWSVGSTHTLSGDDVLLMADTNQTLVGLPGVKGGEVNVMVEEITRDKTVVVFKKRRRKHSRRKNGFRRQVTFLRVLDVKMPGEVKGESMDHGEELQVAA